MALNSEPGVLCKIWGISVLKLYVMITGEKVNAMFLTQNFRFKGFTYMSATKQGKSASDYRLRTKKCIYVLHC